nr:hypothetical protein [Tanacetum cinerariifolium]
QKKNMGSEATWTAKNSPESPSLELNELITKLKSSMKEMVEENQGLQNELVEIKKVNDECLKKLRIYEKRVLDIEVWVSGLEKLGKELDSPDFSDKQKNHVLGITFLTSCYVFVLGSYINVNQFGKKLATMISKGVFV